MAATDIPAPPMVIGGYRLPSYEQWQRMPDGVEKWATALLAYHWPGDYGPWPVNVDLDLIVRRLRDALRDHNPERV